jgi:arylsulfatase A-like enzyme
MKPLRLITVVAGLLVAAAATLTHAAAAATPTAPPRPNIIVILADDVGYSDIGCYGGEIRTPNLDRLAQNGLRFTQFYNTARCCPTRASLLTGLYPHQAGVGHMTDDRGYDGYRGELNRRCVTIAEALKPAGYSTYMSGKWHVTRATNPEGPKDNWPLQRGFDRYYGTLAGAASYYDPAALVRDNTMLSAYADPEYQPKRYYFTDAISDHATRFIREHRQRQAGNPFFLYVAYTAGHWPMHALEEDIAKYRGKYDAGYAALRQERYARLKKLGLIDPRWPMAPTVGDWDNVENKAWEARCMEVYAAMLDRMDQGIGRIVQSLEETGQLENTLILYLQDNGACAEGVGRRGNTPRADRPTLKAMRADELQRKIHPDQTRDGYPVLTGTAVMPGPADTYIAYGQGWANVSNTPFREYKHWVHEGGISTPLIAHWPRGIDRSRRNGLVHDPAHLIDIMATCVDVAGATYPKERNGQPITPLEGKSLVPTFSGRPLAERPLFWEHEGNRAVRVGEWKLVAKGANGPWELYRMSEDRTELKNLAGEQPERVKAMAALWQAYAERANVLPLNPRPQPARNFSRRRQFQLEPGQSLARGQAPYVVGQGFTVSAEIAEPGEGVLVAHGGTTHGYSLYVQQGRAVFALRRSGTLTKVVLPEPLPAGPVTVTATLAADGAVTLEAGGHRVTGKVAGPLTEMPVDGLQVGQDSGGRVSDYTDSFRFTGRIRQASIRITP